MKNWKGDLDKPLVSICCITYNHEPYIEDALEGFFIQETDFPFEVVIHDDASTDRTTEIIREYAAKYPNLIKPIYQKENQYSKMGFRFLEQLYKNCKGQFVALCEGDDYWTHAKKLEIQVRFMELNPDCSMCFHPALQVLGSIDNPQFVRNKRIAGEFLEIREIILSRGGFYPTAAAMFKKLPVLQGYIKINDIRTQGDYILAIACVRAGKIGYIDRVMSVFRRNCDSVTQSYKNSITYSKKIDYRNDIIESTLLAIESFDRFLEFRYTNYFFQLKHSFQFIWAKTNIAHLKFNDALRINKKYLSDLFFHQKVALYLMYAIKFLRLKWRT